MHVQRPKFWFDVANIRTPNQAQICLDLSDSSQENGVVNSLYYFTAMLPGCLSCQSSPAPFACTSLLHGELLSGVQSVYFRLPKVKPSHICATQSTC